jgi:hypothetical protein
MTSTILSTLLLISNLISASLFASTAERWPKPDTRLKCGPLTIEVYVSRTAHRFHLVDQISAWDNACHGQYRENMELSPVDETVLEAYREVRTQRRWGAGLEQTFYVPLELEEAVREGIKLGHLTAPEAKVVRETMEHFAQRADALLEERRELLLGAFDNLDIERFTRAAKQLARFTGVKQLVVPAFPLSSPANGGGGMDGGRLRWELHGSEDLAFSVLLNEITHAFFTQRNDDLRALVDRTPGMSMTLIGEGFAYATAPGLYPDGESDNLRSNVSRDLERGRGWGETTYEHQRMFGLALRPLLSEAFETGSTLDEFLPRARDVFVAMEEVFKPYTGPSGRPTLFVAGPDGEAAKDRLRESKYRLSMHCFNHHPKAYEESLARSQSGDLFVLLVAGDDDERIPENFAYLSPVDPVEIERKLSAGRIVEREHTIENDLRVVLLAAPTLEELHGLVNRTTLLDP